MFRPRPEPVGPGQESVWDYPRPPALEPVTKRLRVVVHGETIADTTAGYRVLETSHPPVYYIPPDDITDGALVGVPGGSYCEWKGQAAYFDVVVGEVRLKNMAWAYPSPTSTFEPMEGYVAFYAHMADACYVDDERVTPQPGNFYGGWITSDIVGPFKGGPGSWGW